VSLAAFAPGKVNLSLFVGGERADGRHEVLTLIESVSLADELSVSALESEGSDEVVCAGIEGPNLVSAALAGLRARGWNAPRVRVEIDKRIPVAAGMGGGSADAAAMLRVAQSLEPFAAEGIMELAAELGADVPSQLEPGLVLGTGAGDEVRAIAPLEAHAFVIVPPARKLSTADVYAEADRLGRLRDLDELARRSEELGALGAGVRLPDELIVNDLEPAAISLCPEITDALEAVKGAGADRALVSGSGPTVFGLFWGADASDRAEAAGRSLSRRFKGATSALAAGAGFGHPRLRAQSVVDR
jgi:4-diphosphocytidyl-2-C-methyl-D-erythritol kinase